MTRRPMNAADRKVSFGIAVYPHIYEQLKEESQRLKTSISELVNMRLSEVYKKPSVTNKPS